MENETSDAKVPIVERHKEIDLIQSCIAAHCLDDAITQFPALRIFIRNKRLMCHSSNSFAWTILNQLNHKIRNTDNCWNPIKPLQGLGKGGFPYCRTFQGFFRFKLLEVQLIQQFTASLLPFLKYPSINFAVVSLCRQEKAVQVPKHNRNRQHNNTYLGSKELQSLGMPDMKMQEAALIHKGDSLYAANCQVLEAAKLPADFTTQEKIRLQFYTYYYFSKYALYHPHFGKDDNYIPSKAYYEKLEAITPINASLLALKEYKAFLPDAISAFSNKGKTVASSSTEQSVNYVDATIQDEKVAEFLIDQFVYNFVDNNGLDEADGLIVLFRKHVKDAKSIEKFNALCTKWEKLRSGNPSAASFSYPDINGKTVSLADLKGKYIYIDVWATWCGPCRGELPALKELEEKYAGKDIHFVSLSCDKNKKAWENMVTKDQLKGIQLHMGTDRTFMDAYLINGIPRFILLDRDGKIISANMTRPSDPKTAEKFNELLGL